MNDFAIPSAQYRDLSPLRDGGPRQRRNDHRQRVFNALVAHGFSVDQALQWVEASGSFQHEVEVVRTALGYRREGVSLSWAIVCDRNEISARQAGAYLRRGWMPADVLAVRRTLLEDRFAELEADGPVNSLTRLELKGQVRVLERDWFDLGLSFDATSRYIQAGVRVSEVAEFECRRSANPSEVDAGLDFLAAFRNRRTAH